MSHRPQVQQVLGPWAGSHHYEVQLWMLHIIPNMVNLISIGMKWVEKQGYGASAHLTLNLISGSVAEGTYGPLLSCQIHLLYSWLPEKRVCEFNGNWLVYRPQQIDSETTFPLLCSHNLTSLWLSTLHYLVNKGTSLMLFSRPWRHRFSVDNLMAQY